MSMIAIKEEARPIEIKSCPESSTKEKSHQQDRFLYLDIPIAQSHEIGKFPPGCRVLYSIKKDGLWQTNFATVKKIAINIRTRENAYKIKNTSMVKSMYHKESALLYAPETPIWLAILATKKFIPAVILSALPIFNNKNINSGVKSDEESEEFSVAYSVISLENHSILHGIQDEFIKFRFEESDPPIFPRSLEMKQEELRKKSETKNNDHKNEPKKCEESKGDTIHRVPPKKRKRKNTESQIPAQGTPSKIEIKNEDDVQKVENDADCPNEQDEEERKLKRNLVENFSIKLTNKKCKTSVVNEEEASEGKSRLENNSDETLNTIHSRTAADQQEEKQNESSLQDQSSQEQVPLSSQKVPRSNPRQISVEPQISQKIPRSNLRQISVEPLINQPIPRSNPRQVSVEPQISQKIPRSNLRQISVEPPISQPIPRSNQRQISAEPPLNQKIPLRSSRQISDNHSSGFDRKFPKDVQGPISSNKMISNILYVPTWANMRCVKERVLNERDIIRKRFDCCSITMCNSMMTGQITQGAPPRLKVTGKAESIDEAIHALQIIIAETVKPDDRCLMMRDISFANRENGAVTEEEFAYNFVPPLFTKRKWICILHVPNEINDAVYRCLLGNNGERIKSFTRGSGCTVLFMKNSTSPHIIASAWHIERVRTVAEKIRLLLDTF